MAEIVERLHAVLDELAATDLSGTSLRDEFLELERARARLDAEAARWLRAFDVSCEWSVDGSQSAAAYLVKHTRCARGDAYSRVKVARQVDRLDATRAAWAAGEVTTKHVEAMARARHAARADAAFDTFEPVLLEVARAEGPEDLCGVVRQWRDALDDELDRDGADAVAAAEREQRSVHFSRSTGGRGFGSMEYDALDSEFFHTALKRAYDDLHVAGDTRTPAQQRADALIEICRVYLDHVGDPRRVNLPSVILVSDEATLRGDAVGECRLGSGYRISPTTAERLACHSQMQNVVTEGGVPLAMGRAERTFTPDQFRAMVVRDAHCRGPSCTVGPAHCEAHHLNQWQRDNGPTDLDNGALFCRGHCHPMLHEGGWTLTGNPNGELTFHDRTGRLVGTSTPHQPTKPIRTKRGRKRAKERRERELVSAEC